MIKMYNGGYNNQNKYIPINIKEKVWKTSCYGGKYNFLTPCYTCEKILRPPELIKKRLFKKVHFAKMKKFPKAVFRSVIQKLPDYLNIQKENNLVLICQDCNSRLGSRNIDKDKDHADVIMISDEIFKNYCNNNGVEFTVNF